LTATTEEESGDFSYLYEAEPRRGYARVIVVLLVLAVLGGFLFYKRELLPGWYAAIVKYAAIMKPQNGPQVQASSQATATGISTPASSLPSKTAPNQSAADTNTAASNVPSSETGNLASTSPASAPGNAIKVSPASVSDTRRSVPTAAPAEGTGTVAEIQPAKAAAADADRSDIRPVETNKSTTVASSRPERIIGAGAPRDAGEELASKGQAYLYGNGVARNCDRALVYLRKAADMGSTQACSQLGTLYATGHCVPLDRARAYNWFSLALTAASGHNIWIERNRRMVWDQMTDSEKARALGAQ
jgi:TPR repeat protein